ncbi:TM2 domain-containing protein 1 isoform X2 [Amia ocellicauda]|uniref:TM2 domain-containing protein 1 isoform X2 n=1 Tax=Amia ocellicauda TaxID=2972642 RepID=UPI0034643334
MWEGIKSSMAASRKRKICLPSIFFILFYFISYKWETVSTDGVEYCDKLRLGQYRCEGPKINDETQEPENCTDLVAYVDCKPAPSIYCRFSNGTEFKFSGEEVGFQKPIPCRNVGYSYKVAVALSLFLGWLGADRFYLGYPALGLLKFCTVGFCGIGSLIDFMLISMQIVGPADGSSYIVDYYGARLTRLTITNETFRKTQTGP